MASQSSNPDVLINLVLRVIVMVVVVVAVLRGPLSENTSTAEAGMGAIRNLSLSENNERILAAAGAGEGEQVGCCLGFFLACQLFVPHAYF